MPYTGPLETEEAGFILNADIFIIRENEISFVLSGSDNGEVFRTEGVAKLTEHGFYMAPQLPITCPEYADDYTASIKINHIRVIRRESRCSVTGAWIQDNVSYEFRGNLEVDPDFRTVL